MVYLYSTDFHNGGNSISHFFYFKEYEYYIIHIKQDELFSASKVLFSGKIFKQEKIQSEHIPEFEIPNKLNILNLMYDISYMPIYKEKIIFENI